MPLRKHSLWMLEMSDRQNSLSSTSVHEPMHQRYCCMKKLRGSLGQMPIARHRGTYFTFSSTINSIGGIM